MSQKKFHIHLIACYNHFYLLTKEMNAIPYMQGCSGNMWEWRSLVCFEMSLEFEAVLKWLVFLGAFPHLFC